jgi:phage tail-like protein
MADPQVYTACYISVSIDGLTGVDGSTMNTLLFSNFQPPSWSTQVPKHKFYGDQGKTETLHGGARNEDWTPCTLGRGVDTNHTMFNWVQEIRQKGPTEAKKDIKITVQEPGGTGIVVWSGTGAIVTSYGHGPSMASANDILAESIVIDAEKWDMLDGSGQPINGGPDGGS